MRYEVTAAFEAEFRRMPKRDQKRFHKIVVDDFSPACDAFRAEPSLGFPDRLRVKPVVGARGLFEMTWSFTGPDGRATFEWIDLDGEPAIRWRRIGNHRILDDLRR